MNTLIDIEWFYKPINLIVSNSAYWSDKWLNLDPPTIHIPESVAGQKMGSNPKVCPNDAPLQALVLT